MAGIIFSWLTFVIFPFLQCHIKICAAYGSMKDISVYNVLGLSPSQIYIVGRPTKKYQTLCQVIFLFLEVLRALENKKSSGGIVQLTFVV